MMAGAATSQRTVAIPAMSPGAAKLSLANLNPNTCAQAYYELSSEDLVFTLPEPGCASEIPISIPSPFNLTPSIQ